MRGVERKREVVGVNERRGKELGESGKMKIEEKELAEGGGRVSNQMRKAEGESQKGYRTENACKGKGDEKEPVHGCY